MKKNAYKEMFDNELSHAWYVQTRKLMISLLGKRITKSARILDAGCGTGGTIKLLNNAGFNNIYGIDKSNEAIKFCRKRKIKNLKQGTVNFLPYNKKTYDVVICLDVLYHKGINTHKALSEINRVLKKDGLLYIQEPSYDWIKSKHDIVIETRQRFTLNELRNLVESHNFRIIKTSYFNTIFFFPILIKRIFDKIVSSHSAISDVQPLPKALNFSLLMSLKLENKLINFMNLPLGLSVISLSKKK
ncbi:MAG: Methyltransferase type 11 [Parcubacteria group bacterium GW2011_GWC1_38_6]|uniref:Methyltransferase type 11 n=1 Tax=Candidatus Curtissbacteria bacterium GW2011_GWA1_41_11 TaxID=1618409 RepID=A0A0G0UH57_9BACT|nr:MAG: Methyltransferase type 11 [Parcubacteria group bacterium GW2011_GWC1_38_6]KKR88149.1 MAG: Methyltransferase type 11 [Candidatus Curtissbacteria bacterium GW2011_GWA1_41_11]